MELKKLNSKALDIKRKLECNIEVSDEEFKSLAIETEVLNNLCMDDMDIIFPYLEKIAKLYFKTDILLIKASMINQINDKTSDIYLISDFTTFEKIEEEKKCSVKRTLPDMFYDEQQLRYLAEEYLFTYIKHTDGLISCVSTSMYNTSESLNGSFEGNNILAAKFNGFIKTAMEHKIENDLKEVSEIKMNQLLYNMIVDYKKENTVKKKIKSYFENYGNR